MSRAAGGSRAGDGAAAAAGYDHARVEKSARRRWEKAGGDGSKAKAGAFTCGSMFPTLSSPMHMGHMRNLVLSDVMARYARMRGHDVHHVLGWEAHGIRVRMAADDAGVDPADWVGRARERARELVRRMGVSVDWHDEVTTSDERHVRRQQETFLSLWNASPPLVAGERTAGVAYWDDGMRSFVSLRQLVGSRGPESGMLAKVREVSSYEVEVPRSTCETLLEGLDGLVGWDSFARSMQRESIGLEKGLQITYELRGNDGGRLDDLEVFTSRPDTLMGATYLAVGVNHPLSSAVAEADPRVREFCDMVSRPRYAYQKMREEKRQEGMPLGAYAINPINGDHIPVWVTNYVVAGYGTGATLGVPGHDQRSHNFALRHNLPIRRVALDDGESLSDPPAGPFTGKRGVAVNSGGLEDELNGLRDGLAGEKDLGDWDERVNDCVLGFLRRNGVAAKKATVARLRGWKVSQDEYWGSPVPLVHCESCGTVPVPGKQLPVLLPDYKRGKESLSDYPGFVSCECPRCGGKAERDTDTLSELFSSSWDRWGSRGQVDFYCCGVEHATTHLLCARIMGSHLHDVGARDSGAEPFASLLCLGTVLNYGLPMARWYGNAIEPGRLLDECGADTLRALLATSVDPRHPLHWDDARLFALQGELTNAEFESLRKGELRGIKAELARRVLGPGELARLQSGLLARGGLERLRDGTLDGELEAKAREILGEGGMTRLREGFLSASELKSLRKGDLDPLKMDRVREALSEAEIARLQRGLLDEQDLRLLVAGKLPKEKLDGAVARVGERTVRAMAESGIDVGDGKGIARIQEEFLDEAEERELAREGEDVELLRKARSAITEDELLRHSSGLLDRVGYDALRDGSLSGEDLGAAAEILGNRGLARLRDAALDRDGHKRMLLGELDDAERERMRAAVGAEMAGRLEKATFSQDELRTLARAAQGLDRIEVLRAGRLSPSKERKALEAAGEELVGRLRSVDIDRQAMARLVAEVDPGKMSRLVGFIDDEAMSRLVKAVGKDGAKRLREIGPSPRRARPLLRFLPAERMDRLLDFVSVEKMDALVDFVGPDKMERLLGFTGLLWHQVAAKADLVRKADGTGQKDPRRARLHACLASVDACYAKDWPLGGGSGNRFMELNSLLSRLREMLALLETATSADDGGFARECCRVLLAVAHPVMPHVTEELWALLGLGGTLADAPWPEPDAGALGMGGKRTHVVQVNGRKRLALVLDGGTGRDEAVEAAREALDGWSRGRGLPGFPAYGEELAEVEAASGKAGDVINFVVYKIP